MSEDDLKFLSLIGSTEETAFSELCQQLGDDCPDNKAEWRDLFQKIRELESQGYVEVNEDRRKDRRVNAYRIRGRIDSRST